MSQMRVLQVPIYVDLRPFLVFLYQQSIYCLVTEEGKSQVLWVQRKECLNAVCFYYGYWQFGLLELSQLKTQEKKIGSLFSNLSHNIKQTKYPMTWFFVLVSLIFAGVTGLGSSVLILSYFTYVPMDVVTKFANTYIRFYPLSTVFEQKEYWRLITPIFLHFGWMHLAFNMMWTVDIGRRIEKQMGSFHLGGVIVITGLISNFAQYYWGGEAEVFGGFSGVVYGLFGYCMARSFVDKRVQFGILPAVYIVMCVFLLLGYTGIFTKLFGHVANEAHTSGLFSGFIIGGLIGLLFKK